MNDPMLIPIMPSNLHGEFAHLVDARRLHQALESKQDFSVWIKNRIRKYGFEEGKDWLTHKTVEQLPHLGSTRTVTTIDYLVTRDMAKELAMVERTTRGREARRYFIACERQLRQMQQALPVPVAAPPAPLSRSEQQAINRQAWADVSGDVQQTFHARREALAREYAKAKAKRPAALPPGYRPWWAE